MKSINTKYEDQGKYTSKIIKNKAFTLVELIIVITILAILATIAFVSFKNYAGSARDGNKLTTLSSIEKGLSLYQIKIGNYPTPDNIYGSGSYSGALLSQVGFVGSGVVQSINMNKIPKDPIVNFEYTYGLSNNKKYYQLGTVLENNETAFIQQKYANNYTSKVVGNYKGLYRFSTGGLNYIINLPSLLFTQSGAQDFGNISNDPKFVINNGGNLVKPYDNNNVEEVSTILEKLTKIEGVVLKAEMIPTDWNSGSGILRESLGYSEDEIGYEIYGETYYADKDNLKGPVAPPIVYASCSFEGTIVEHATSVTAYETASVTYGNTCMSEQRSCDNGILSGSFTHASCNVDGATGTFTLSQTSVTAGTSVTISNTCSTAPTSYTSSNEGVATILGTTITTISAGTTTITPVGGACGDNAGKELTVTIPICTSFTYSAWGACQPNNARTRTITSQNPSGCTGGTPDVLEESCTYVPPIVQWKDISGTSCDNNDYVFTHGGTTYRWAGCNSVLGSGFEWGKQDNGTNGTIGSCYSYNSTNTVGNCPIATSGNAIATSGDAMYSTAKEKSWNQASSVNGTVNNIWGKLYTWDQAKNGGACPSGWHLPTDGEWEILETYLNTTIKNSPRSNCRNATAGWLCPGLGWSGNSSEDIENNMIRALKIPLAGHRSTDGATFYNRGNSAHLWSSSESGTSAYYRTLYWSNDTVGRYLNAKTYGFSVRCLKD